MGEIKVPDIRPNAIESVRFVYEDWKPIADREYKHGMPDGSAIEGNKTDGNGFIRERNFLGRGRRITLKAIGAAKGEVSGESHPDPLPTLDLRDKAHGGQGSLGRGDSRKGLVKDLQHMLKALEYDLGDYGPDHDGVDGVFGVNTEARVKDFQGAHKDWEVKKLAKDGLVGPRTADALNRILVGKWYDRYDTPTKLTQDLKLVTMTEKIAEEKGISL